MHKPLSYGSALQTYALQKKVSDLGYNAEIIDYKYPNEAHKKKVNLLRHWIEETVSFVINIFLGFPNMKKRSNFNCFYKEYYRLSPFYPTEKTLKDNPPKYDIYMSGSDQVWNPNFILEDRTFLLSFVKDNSIRVSYGSSFAVSNIPEDYKPSYIECLSKYDMITVRETSGINVIKELTGKDATLVCDPTLLLSAGEWDKIADKADINIEVPYLLVFILGYSFNPYPKVVKLINKIKSQLRLKTIFLDGRKEDAFQSNSKIIKNAGPADFINLVRNASYVITDSFHGTVFSTIYSKPLTALVKPGNNDSRISSFLRVIGREDCAVPFDSTSFEIKLNECTNHVASLIDISLRSLNKMLSL